MPRQVLEALLLISKRHMPSRCQRPLPALASCFLHGHPGSTLYPTYAEPSVVSSTFQGVSSSGPPHPEHGEQLLASGEHLRPRLRTKETNQLGHTCSHRHLPSKSFPGSDSSQLQGWAGPLLLLCTKTRLQSSPHTTWAGAEDARALPQTSRPTLEKQCPRKYPYAFVPVTRTTSGAGGTWHRI